ncbi:MAG: hypothetical protein IJD70_02430, partial [Clostridia bacterium]|nr:hypothetical protein [Clostridia bacterium]
NFDDIQLNITRAKKFLCFFALLVLLLLTQNSSHLFSENLLTFLSRFIAMRILHHDRVSIIDSEVKKSFVTLLVLG